MAIAASATGYPGAVVSRALVWISGASGGVGRALVATVPWRGARIVGIGRRPVEGIDHLEADLADPRSWSRVGGAFASAVRGDEHDCVVFVHAAGTLDPIGFAAEVDSDRYTANVLLNAAASQVLGHLFLKAVTPLPGKRSLVLLSSGAARTVYPGWSSYGAAKAAIDQWVRTVGAEQARRGAVQVLAVAPGTVDTPMQATLRATSEHDFPQRQKFVDLHRSGRLTAPEVAARGIWELVERDLPTGSVVDLRDLFPAPS